MISGHLTITDHVVISGGTLVAKSITEPGTYTAVFPMQPHAEWLKNAALVRHLHELIDRVRSRKLYEFRQPSADVLRRERAEE